MLRAAQICKAAGCSTITRDPSGYCEAHRAAAMAALEERKRLWRRKTDECRGSASERGYDARWSRYSKWYLKQPGHQLCALRISPRCSIVAQCVDHIDPPDSRYDPRFWDQSNHQPACLACNTLKGHRFMVGKFCFNDDDQPTTERRSKNASPEPENG